MRGFVAGFGHAARGLLWLAKNERNARVHLAATVLVTGAGIWFGLARAEWLWVAGAIGLVWCAEALNTAIEALADTLHPDRAAGIGRAKDLAAGAVLAAALAAAAIGVLVFWPHLFG